ncbi:MAG: L-threonylcarbamoyladenylate synthase [Pyrinomonadaceae bacterium]
METIVTTDPMVAAEVIRSGGTAAFPTETVYGLGANVFDEAAIQKLFDAKRRPQDNPLIAHIGHLDQLDQLTRDIPGFAWDLIDTFFPGPLTLVLQKGERVPLIATAGLETIGVRMPGHELAREFLTACSTPVVAPSANLSGRPSPTTWEAVKEDLDGRIDCILKGDATEIGLESTVVDCTGTAPVVLRPGAISLEQLQEIVPEAFKASDSDSGAALKSPGMRHRHYSPRAAVVIVKGAIPSGGPDSAFIGTDQAAGQFGNSLILSSVEEYARSVFEFFRECDRRGVKTIYCEAVPETGVGAALMDRLRRAAQG